MMKRGAYIIILYLILLLCVKEIRGDGEEDDRDLTMDTIDSCATECQRDPECKKKLDDTLETGNSNMAKLKDGIEVVKELAALLKKAVKKGQIKAFAEQIADIAGKFGSVLPVIGPLVALVAGFLPSEDSQNIAHLRDAIQTGFTVINDKLEGVYNKIDSVGFICRSEAYKTRIQPDKDKILNARIIIRQWIERSDRLRMTTYTSAVYNQDGGRIREATINLRRTIITPGYREALIDAEYSNRENINNKLLQLYALAYAGTEAYLTWARVRVLRGDPDHTDLSITEQGTTFNTSLHDIMSSIIQFDADTFTDDWWRKLQLDTKQIVEDGGTSQAISTNMYTFLKGKYDWIHPFVIVYDFPGNDWETNRYWINCPNNETYNNTYGQINWKKKDKTFFVGIRNISDSFRFNVRKAYGRLNSFRTWHSPNALLGHTNYETALEVFNTNNDTAGMCTEWLIKGVIKSNIRLHINSATRYAHVVDKNGWDFIML